MTKREYRVFGVWTHGQGRSAKVCLETQARFIVEISITCSFLSFSCLHTITVFKLFSSNPSQGNLPNLWRDLCYCKRSSGRRSRCFVSRAHIFVAGYPH